MVVPQDTRPTELEYVEGRSPPPGYYEKSSIRKGFVIPGAITFGVTYGYSALFAILESADGSSGDVLLIPVVGPIIWGYTDDCDEYGGSCGDPTVGWVLGLGQAVGITLFVAGIAKEDKVWRREDLAGGSVTLSPMLVGGRTPGLGLTARL